MREEIEKAFEIVKNGGIILYPTDTIWGIGCDPKNEKALEKINLLKKRNDKHFIILVESERLLNRYAKIIPEVCYDLIDFAEKPLTIIYPKGQFVAKQVLAKDGSIAVRVVKDKFCRTLIQKLKSGIISTSANISGEKSPIKFEDISDSIKNGVDYIVNLPLTTKTPIPSQIIKIGENSEVTIIRK